MSATSDLILAARRHRSRVLLAQRDRGGETLMIFQLPPDGYMAKLRDMMDADRDLIRKMLYGEFPPMTEEEYQRERRKTENLASADAERRARLKAERGEK